MIPIIELMEKHISSVFLLSDMDTNPFQTPPISKNLARIIIYSTVVTFRIHLSYSILHYLTD